MGTEINFQMIIKYNNPNWKCTSKLLLSENASTDFWVSYFKKHWPLTCSFEDNQNESYLSSHSFSHTRHQVFCDPLSLELSFHNFLEIPFCGTIMPSLPWEPFHSTAPAPWLANSPISSTFSSQWQSFTVHIPQILEWLSLGKRGNICQDQKTMPTELTINLNERKISW